MDLDFDYMLSSMYRVINLTSMDEEQLNVKSYQLLTIFKTEKRKAEARG